MKEQILQMLDTVRHELPDMTSRRFLRNPAIRARLQELIPHLPYPSISDLHVSLANRDHLRSYIKQAKEEHFPYGTGWKGE